MSENLGQNPLRGRIISMYHSVLNFSKHVRWSSRKAYDIVNKKQEPTAGDIEVICNALNVEVPDDFRSLFF